jgi:hypothetical protein
MAVLFHFGFEKSILKAGISLDMFFNKALNLTAAVVCAQLIATDLKL